ncbi:hypothetical protein MAR_009744 [Mya arenaria]|uniref:Uncharacterized protein n=1 Tax=Mya arenaria TaxID=6604 RepID=A0ABY7E2M3_MYAAR|nr:hypothetical protein MAR_009744 [Mya arenaria]
MIMIELSLASSSFSGLPAMSLKHWDRMQYGRTLTDRPDPLHALHEAGRRLPEEPAEQVPPHHEWTPYKGPLVWTGPDSNRNYRPHQCRDWQSLGVGELSAEKTLSATYIRRAPDDQPFPSTRAGAMGEIGWFYKDFSHSIRPSRPANLNR